MRAALGAIDYQLLLTFKAAAAVTGSGFIVLAAALGSVGHIPVTSIALILASTASCRRAAH